jgi:hypothetical protein
LSPATFSCATATTQSSYGTTPVHRVDLPLREWSEEMEQALKDSSWYLVRYELLSGDNATAPAMYKHDAKAFYSYLFSGIPVRQVTVIREIDCSEEIKRLPHQHCKTHGSAQPNVWACPECLVLLREKNKRMEEALLRLRMWGGIGKNWSANEAHALAEWIDGGMTGELPPYPDYYPPFRF